MKKIFSFVVALCLLTQSFATVSIITPPKKATEVMIPIGNSGLQISLADLAVISVKDFETVSGRHLTLAEKGSFKLAQKQLRNSIAQDGTLKKSKLAKLARKADEGGGFHLGGFALGFLLGLIGVLIAYLINDDKKRTRVKWAWLGLLIGVVLYLLLLLA